MSKLFESIFTPGPIVEATDIFKIYFPLTVAGLDDYVNGKYKKTIMKKIDSRLSKWLESTYGAIVFQE